MKKLYFIMITMIILGSVLVGCSENSKEYDSNKEPENEEKVQQHGIAEQEDERTLERLKSGVMLTGEAIKGGNYLINVSRGYVDKNVDDEKNQTLQNVVVTLSVKNVREDTKVLDLGDLRYELHEKNSKVYNGKVTTDLETLNAGETADISVLFEVPSVNDSYNFFVKSKIEPIEAYWIIENLNTNYE